MTSLARSRRLAGLIALSLAVPLAAVAQPAAAVPPPLIVFDIRPFLAAQPSDKFGYDYLKLLTAMQGIVNRDEPRLHLIGDSSYIAQGQDFEPDAFWLDQLTDTGEYLDGVTIVEAENIEDVFDEFLDEFDGVVVWDGEVPSTANVAATAAGVEDLLPVRYDPTQGSPYDRLVVDEGLDVQIDLEGKFTGVGTMPDSTRASTGSAKNDAYIWAKERYIDTGLVNAHLMAYALDAASWSSPSGEMSLQEMRLPDSLAPGQSSPVSLTYKNLSSQTWTVASLDRLGTEAGNQFTWSDLNGGYSNSLDAQRVFLDAGAAVEPGDEVTFEFTITAPTTEGDYEFAAGIVRDGVAWYSGTQVSQSISVEGPRMGTSVVSMTLPDALEPGQSSTVSLTYENLSAQTWTRASFDRVGTETGNQFIWTDLNGGYSNSLDAQRFFLDSGASIAPNDEVTVDFTITAPATEGDYVFAAGVVRDGVAWYPDTLASATISVVTGAGSPTPVTTTRPDALGLPPAETPELVPTYPDLFNSFLLNADYYIAEKAFFFDLSPDGTSIPNDDPGQPLGTDYATLVELLRDYNELANDTVITVGGFIPWWLKYTTYVDPNASFEPVALEWRYADLVSGYYAQKDADAYGLVGLANASLYRQVPLASSFTQINDRGVNGKTYVEGREYVTFYMGDYDSGAWTAGSLPGLWNDSARGQLPLAWPPNANLSQRVPQVFNYLYETQTTNDYFVGGDNGVGYLNPMMLLDENRPDGLPDRLDSWAAYNAAYYDQFDLDLTGFLISGNTGNVPLEVQEAYAAFSPEGVGTNSGFDEPVVNGTPFMTVRDFPVETASASEYGEALAAVLRGPNDFHVLRDILIAPTLLLDAVEYVQTTYPELDFEVVDPYTNFRLYKDAQPWAAAPVTYDSPVAAMAPSIDGVMDAGEWDDAGDMTVSKDAVVATKGYVWGSQTDAADLTSNYRVRWDEDNLYLLEDRVDDSAQFTATNGAVYSADASIFFFDMGFDRRGSAYRDGDYAVLVSPSSPSSTPLVYLREGHDSGAVERALPAAQIATTFHAGGYTMEMAIPWTEFQVTPFTPEDDVTIGFTVLATDNDGPANWGQIMWAGDGDNQAYWGALRLVDPSATPVPIAAVCGAADSVRVGSTIRLLADTGAGCGVETEVSVAWETRPANGTWVAAPVRIDGAFVIKHVSASDDGREVRAVVTALDGRTSISEVTTVDVAPTCSWRNPTCAGGSFWSTLWGWIWSWLGGGH